MYNPPDEEDCEFYYKAYNLGFKTAMEGGIEGDNPYKPSEHERDTTFDDELYFYWIKGFGDYE